MSLLSTECDDVAASPGIRTGPRPSASALRRVGNVRSAASRDSGAIARRRPHRCPPMCRAGVEGCACRS